MKRSIFLFLSFSLLGSFTFGQGKILIGIVPFNNNANYHEDKYRIAVQDLVGDAFINTKRFTLVEREKMEQIKSEKNLQKNEDFIDGSVVQQSAALGAQYIIVGNITQAGEDTKTTSAPFVGTTTDYHADVAFSIRVVDVSTGEIVASSSYSSSKRGKDGFNKALEEIRPDIEDFIKKNFKITITLAQVDAKDKDGNATKVLIAGGSSLGLKANCVLKVFELSELVVDGKKLPRKVPIGKITIAEVQDENFSECIVTEGGADIAAKVAAGSKIKCEIIGE